MFLSKKYLIVLLLPIFFNACTQQATMSEENSSEITTETLSSTSNSPQKDIAKEVLKLIDRNLIPSDFTDDELAQILNKQREFDEYTLPERIEVVHYSDNDSGCSQSISINTFTMNNGLNYVLYISNSGCDGSSSELVKTFNYDQKQLIEVPTPFAVPKFAEFEQGANIPPQLQDRLKWLRSEYQDKTELDGYDIRFNSNDSQLLEIRPSYIADYELVEFLTPVTYRFNGGTFVKQ